MKWTVNLEADGFGFKAEIDNDGEEISTRAPTAYGALYSLAKEIELSAKRGTKEFIAPRVAG